MGIWRDNKIALTSAALASTTVFVTSWTFVGHSWGLALVSTLIVCSVVLCFGWRPGCDVSGAADRPSAVKQFIAAAAAPCVYGSMALLIWYYWNSVNPNANIRGGGRGRGLLRFAVWAKQQAPQYGQFLGLTGVALFLGGLWRGYWAGTLMATAAASSREDGENEASASQSPQ
jgi:hypothetical protein